MATEYSDRYDPETDFDRHYTVATAKRIRRWFRPGDRVLEFGPANGYMTSLLAERDVRITAVEMSANYVEQARARGIPNAEFVQGTVEDFETGERFNHVIGAHLINELTDPQGFLERCRELLAPGGLFHISFTNPRSIHRMVALELGMIEDLHALSALGADLGTKQIFEAETLIAMGREAGLTCVHREGILVKPLTNAQMAELPDEVIEGFDLLARHFPDHGALNYLIFVAEE
jgi:2-polyprenyl-3-methyl-5-hydroxy-6-metoxy-1,4-benzoquinol methylase